MNKREVIGSRSTEITIPDPASRIGIWVQYSLDRQHPSRSEDRSNSANKMSRCSQQQYKIIVDSQSRLDYRLWTGIPSLGVGTRQYYHSRRTSEGVRRGDVASMVPLAMHIWNCG
jgi:hypothetical protein